MAGGYGRGEGGIYRETPDSRPSLYNDLEFYLMAPGVPPNKLRSWMHHGETSLGIEVECKCITPSEMQSARPSMFYYDLLSRHVHVAGDPEWVAALPVLLRDSRAIPQVEASRLLVNRGMSLLRCSRWADGTLELPDGFCQRITHKLKLALADAVLCSQGRCHWSAVRRHELVLQPCPQGNLPPDWSILTESRHFHLLGAAKTQWKSG